MSTSDSDTPDTPERTSEQPPEQPPERTPADSSSAPLVSHPATEPPPDPVVATAPVAEPADEPAGGPTTPVAVATPPVLSPAPVPAVALPAGAPAASGADEPAATPTESRTPAPGPTPADRATPPAGGGTATVTDRSDDLFPPGSAPFTTSAGSHVIGVLVGALLAPVGMALALLGQSRILVVQVDGWDASADLAGIVLVTVGLLLLATVLVLTLWTPAASIAGGVLLTAAGVVYLFAPRVAREQTLVLLPSEHWHVTLTQVTVAGTSGTVLVAGFMLLVSGVVAVVVRRHGIQLGVFRERHHPGRSTLPPPKDARTTSGAAADGR